MLILLKGVNFVYIVYFQAFNTSLCKQRAVTCQVCIQLNFSSAETEPFDAFNEDKDIQSVPLAGLCEFASKQYPEMQVVVLVGL